MPNFGMFIHWGVYSVTCLWFGMYSRNMYIQGNPCYDYHREHFGDQASFGYKDLIPLFTADRFDPASWLDLFQKAGAQYLFPVAEHHDGFQMYASTLSPYNSLEMGPRRDVLGELRKEAEKRGLHFCTSSHRAEHQFFFSHGKEFTSDIPHEVPRDSLYWPAEPEPKDHFDLTSKALSKQRILWKIGFWRTCELVRDYQPELLYFDWWIQHESFRPYLMRFLAYYYNLVAQEDRKVAVCYKQDALLSVQESLRWSGEDTERRKPFRGKWIPRSPVILGAIPGLAYKTSKELLQKI